MWVTPTDDSGKCVFCRSKHETVCPLVSAMDYDEFGRITRVEFFPLIEYENESKRLLAMNLNKPVGKA